MAPGGARPCLDDLKAEGRLSRLFRFRARNNLPVLTRRAVVVHFEFPAHGQFESQPSREVNARQGLSPPDQFGQCERAGPFIRFGEQTVKWPRVAEGGFLSVVIPQRWVAHTLVLRCAPFQHVMLAAPIWRWIGSPEGLAPAVTRGGLERPHASGQHPRVKG